MLKNTNSNNGSIFFIIGYSIWVMVNSFLITVDGLKNLSSLLKIVAILFWGLAVLFEKWKKREFYRLLIFLALCSLISYKTHEINPMVLGIAIFSSYKTSIYKIAICDFCVRFVGVVSTIISYLLGFSSGNDFSSTWNILPIRYSLGYYHPNNLFAQFFALCVGLFVIKRAHLNIKTYIFLLVIDVILGVLTQSRTGMVILSLNIILFAFINNKRLKRKIFAFIFSYIYLICFFISVLGIIMFSLSNNAFVQLNVLLSGRLDFSNRVFSTYGVKLFGQVIEYSSTLNARQNNSLAVVVDNCYIYFLVSYGLIFTIAFLVLITYEEKRLLKLRKMEIIIPMVGYALYSITEKPFASINNHFLILILADAIVSIHINKFKKLHKKVDNN
ncbi:hypothetical protein SAMN02745229_03940 [Butyrivibrio fibrisolvens DSM 3071]|uniref:O-antigen ligase like membrane protein n=1 Tax=Butyrivibrio fibrisolvens DSM 3071 TaxID=1121131 RepID=A0A1M6FMT3_BUTFI|nr:hypothetical protein [Butyrivibrio fibrisolvens]SHI99021.1 hypothetical protein SAMN02745229_03940 [Butyrivibrio fibrisolvens DSM 3071]